MYEPHYEEEAGGGGFVFGLLVGAALGAAVGLMFAPKAGSELRQTLYDSTGDIRKKATDAYGQATQTVNDYVVLAHCSWYFDSVQRLRHQLTAARAWAATLCFSEWDLSPHDMAQVPHHLAVLALAQLGDETGNIRTPLSRQRATTLIADTGWKIVTDVPVDSRDLQDGHWEIEACRRAAGTPGLSSLVASQLDVLLAMSERSDVTSLGSYSILAHRA